MEVELTAGAITTMWGGASGNYTVQIVDYKHLKEKQYKLVVSDGVHYHFLLANDKPKVTELLEEKKEAVKNYIANVEVKCTENPKDKSKFLLFLQSLEILKEDASKIGSPSKYEPEAIAKATVVASPQTEQPVTTTSASTPQTAVKSEGKTQHSPSPKGPGGVTPDNTPPKSQSVTPLNMSQSADLCVPIAQLTMYQRPTIKGRIANKDSVRAFKGRDGTEKKVFSVEIMDETCDMKVTFWDKAADKFYDVLEVGKTYTFSKIGLKMANSKFNATKCPYEMSVGEQSVIELCLDTDAPKMLPFTFVGIEKLEEKVNKNCDIIGIVQEVTSKTEIQLKNGKGSKPKRNVTLVDQSGKTIVLTLWDHLADEVVEDNASRHDVVALRALRVSEYNGCSLNTTRSSVIQINPELPEATKLQEWYSSGGDKTSFTSLSSGGGGGGGGANAPRKFIADLDMKQATDKPIFFQLKCTITFSSATQQDSPDGKKRAWCYTANPENKKKVVMEGAGWRDESTGKYLDECQRRYIANFRFTDETGQTYMTVFDEHCQKLLGMSADDLYKLEMEESSSAFRDVWDKALFSQQIIKVRAKSEEWEGQHRLKCSVTDMQPVNYADESKYLLERIRNYV